MNIHKGDDVLMIDGKWAIVTSEVFKASSYFAYDAIRIETDICEMPVQVVSVVEVWRHGVRVDTQEQVEQLPLI